MNLPPGSSWKRYRRFQFAICILLPIFVAFGAVSSLKPLTLLMGLCGGAVLFCEFAMQFFKCPRCSKSFFSDHGWSFWSESCLHCGLPKWQEADYVDPRSDAYQNLSILEMASDVSVGARERDSKFLLLVLRDDPGAIHLTLDPAGWADVRNLLTRANRYGFHLTHESLADAISSSPGRFEWAHTGNRVRAIKP